MDSREDADRLIELSDGRFQLMSGGVIAPFMSGHSCVLVEKRLSEFLIDIGVEGLRIQPAIIFRREGNIEYESHDRLEIRDRFESTSIGDLDTSGNKIFLMDSDCCFVTSSLKEKIEEAGFTYLEFTKGLERFASSDPHGADRRR